nr:hypothetical protein [Tanacetum cinerariifolium]
MKQVVAFTPSAGVLGWVNGTLPLKDYLTGSSKSGGARGCYSLGDWSFRKCMQHMATVGYNVGLGDRHLLGLNILLISFILMLFNFGVDAVEDFKEYMLRNYCYGVVQPVAPNTAEQRLAKKNELKAQGTLLMALPDKNQLKFNTHKDDKSLMEAIEKSFGGNKETKKKLISQLEILGESLSQEDINLKFLRSLPTEWRTHTLIWRNKTDLEDQSLDDMFNNLKIYEAEVKSSSSTSPTTQNIAFVSSQNTNSTNELVSAVTSVSAASTKVLVSTLPNVDNLSDAVIYSFFASQSNSPQLDNDDLKQIDADDLEEMDLKWQMAMLTMRARRKSQFDVLSYKTGLEFVEARLVVYQQNENMFEEDIKLLKLDVMLRDNALVELRKKFKKAEQERDELKIKLENFQISSKNLSKLLAGQITNKTGLGYDNQVFNSTVFDYDELISSESDVSMPTSPVHDRPTKHGVNKAHSPIRRTINLRPSAKKSNFYQKVTTVQANQGNPRHDLKDKGIIDSGCSRHMTWNISYLSDFEEINRGYVAFGGNPKGDPQNTDVAAFEVKELESAVHVSQSSCDKTKKHDDKTKRDAKGKSHVELSTGVRDLSDEFEEFSDNSTNGVNAVSTPVTAVGPNLTNSTATFSAVGMPALEDITYSDDEEDVGAEADFSNLETNITVSPIPTTRVYKDHLVTYIIVNLSSAPQTNSMTRMVKEQGEPKRVHQALKDPSWIEAMQEELLQFKMQKVWVLVDLPKGKRVIGSKWVFRNKKDERGIVIRNKARLVAQGHTQEECIDYEEVFAPVARIEAIRLFLAYASFMGFMVYQMDVKSAFLYETIEEEVYVCQPSCFKDPNYPDKVYKVVKALYGLHQAPRAWYDTLANYLLENGFQQGKIDQTLFIKKQKAFEKLMKDKFQMSSMGELTFFLGLQVKQKQDGIFISQDKYAVEILKKFVLTDRKSASTPIDTEKPLLKDPDVKRIFRYLKGKPHLGLWYPKDSPFNLMTYSNSDFAGTSLDRKSTTRGCQFLGCSKISWQCKKQTVVATSYTKAEYVATASCCAQVLWIQNQLLDYGNEALAIPGQTAIVDEKDRIEVSAVDLKLLLSGKFLMQLLFGLTIDAAHLLLLGHKYALMVNPTIYVSYIKQFWTSVSIKKTNDVMRMQALIDRKKMIISEDSIRQALRLDDADSVDCLPNEKNLLS